MRLPVAFLLLCLAVPTLQLTKKHSLLKSKVIHAKKAKAHEELKLETEYSKSIPLDMTGHWWIRMTVNDVNLGETGAKVGDVIKISSPAHTKIDTSWGVISWGACTDQQNPDGAVTTCTVNQIDSYSNILYFGVIALDSTGIHAKGEIGIGGQTLPPGKTTITVKVEGLPDDTRTEITLTDGDDYEDTKTVCTDSSIEFTVDSDEHTTYSFQITPPDPKFVPTVDPVAVVANAPKVEVTIVFVLGVPAKHGTSIDLDMNGAWWKSMTLRGGTLDKIGHQLGDLIEIESPPHTKVGNSWGSLTWGSCSTVQQDKIAVTSCTLSNVATYTPDTTFGVSALDQVGTQAKGEIFIRGHPKHHF